MSHFLNSPVFTGNPQAPTPLTADNSTSIVTSAWVRAQGFGVGSATVSQVTVTTANGVSGVVATNTTTPAITITLGAITPTSVNGLTLAAAANGFTLAGGTASKTMTFPNTLTLSGTDNSTLNIGTGGTLGSAAYTASSTYAAVGQTFFLGTTSVAVNRASAAIALTGITSIDGQAATVVTNANLTGDVTSSGNTTTLPTATVQSKLISNFVLGADASALAATDSFIQAFQKLQVQVNAKQASLGFTAMSAANLSTVTTLGTSDTLFPSQNAVKVYVDTATTGLLDDRGNFNASVNTFPTTGGSGAAGAILKGDLWYISVIATSGVLLGYPVGCSVRALTDAPGQTAANWDILNVGLGYVPYNATNPSGFTSNAGTVTTLTVTTANGVSGAVATAGTTPAITITLGAITPTSVNGLTLAAAANGFTLAGGTTSKTMTFPNTLTISGTDTSTLNIGTGGTLGTAAYTAATAYAAVAAVHYVGTTSIAANRASAAMALTGITSIDGQAATVVTNANLTGDVTSSGNATTLSAATVVGKALTGFVLGSDSAAIAATDTIVAAFQKLQVQSNSKQSKYGAVATKSGVYTITNADETLLCDATSGAFAITLPAAPVSGEWYSIQKIDSSVNAVTIGGNGKNVMGAASQTLPAQWNSYTVQYNGTAWFVW